jgi:hypothetical protein
MSAREENPRMSDSVRSVLFQLAPIVAAVLGGLASPSLAQSQAVSPADRTGLEGSSFTSFPLGRPNARFQFLHADLPGGMTIHGHAYRRDAAQVRGTVDGFAVELEVSMSMSPRTPATASPTFADNAGPSPTVVLPRTTLVFPSTNRPAIDPAPTFELMIPYALPFVLPAGGGTLCVDTVMHANVSAAGVDRSLTVYLDSHEISTTQNEQPGFRSVGGCAPLGAVATANATMALRRTGTGLQLDCSARDGVPDRGNGMTHSYLAFGATQQSAAWPFRPACVLQSSSEHWFVLGRNDVNGDCMASLQWPLLPSGYRVYLQVGSIELGGSDLVFSDLTQVVTPPAAPATLSAARVAASTNRAALTGTVSTSVPVTLFY